MTSPGGGTSADEADFRWPIGRSALGTARPFGRSAVGSGSLRKGMVSNAVRSIWAEPWRRDLLAVADWVLVAVLVATAILGHLPART